MRLDQGKFARWLKTKPSAEIIGYQRDCHSCPIANFYEQTSGGCEVLIFDDGYGNHIIDRGYDRRRLPAWAEAFVFLVDGEEAKIITARRAMEILSTIS